jgi:N6-adenosine-specific RNA methylase IME4
MKSAASHQIFDVNRVRFNPAHPVEQPVATSLSNLQGRYAVIYADPPWHFATYSARGEGRSASAHYRCMAFPDLCNLPVRDLAAPDCCLFLWTTDPMLPKALGLIEAWGFTYKTVAFTWAKLNQSAAGPSLSTGDFFTGMGYWTRANPEQCLLATIGKPRRLSRAVRQLIVSPRREHSRKPDEAYARMNTLSRVRVWNFLPEAAGRVGQLGGDQVGLLGAGHVLTDPSYALSGDLFRKSAD